MTKKVKAGRRSDAPLKRKRRGAGARKPDARGDREVRIFGLHAVEAALNNPQRNVLKLLLTENAERRIAEAVRERDVTPEHVLPRALDKLLGADTVHQGAVLVTEDLPNAELGDLVAAARGGRPIVVLDQVTDPHNVGAVLRSAAVFGAGGLIMTWRHSPPLSGALAKSASGALDMVPICLVQNLSRALESLKNEGVEVIGLDGEADDAFETHTTGNATAFVLGAEGKGLRQLTAQTCDQLYRITTAGEISSLNVSNAAAIILHHHAVQRQNQS